MTDAKTDPTHEDAMAPESTDQQTPPTDTDRNKQEAARIAIDAARQLGRACQILGESSEGETFAEIADTLHSLGTKLASGEKKKAKKWAPRSR